MGHLPIIVRFILFPILECKAAICIVAIVVESIMTIGVFGQSSRIINPCNRVIIQIVRLHTSLSRVVDQAIRGHPASLVDQLLQLLNVRVLHSDSD